MLVLARAISTSHFLQFTEAEWKRLPEALKPDLSSTADTCSAWGIRSRVIAHRRATGHSMSHPPLSLSKVRPGSRIKGNIPECSRHETSLKCQRPRSDAIGVSGKSVCGVCVHAICELWRWMEGVWAREGKLVALGWRWHNDVSLPVRCACMCTCVRACMLTMELECSLRFELFKKSKNSSYSSLLALRN